MGVEQAVTVRCDGCKCPIVKLLNSKLFDIAAAGDRRHLQKLRLQMTQQHGVLSSAVVNGGLCALPTVQQDIVFLSQSRLV